MNSSVNTQNTLKFFSFLFVVTILAYFSGCSNNTTSPVQTDDQFITQVIQSGYSSDPNDPDNAMSVDTAAYNDGGAVPDSGSGPMSPIDSLVRWGRQVISSDLNLNITNSGDIKTVNITRTINGNYIIVYQHNGQFITVTKPYTEALYRTVQFKRVGTNRDPRFNWRLYSISLLSGGTTQPQNGSITQMTQIQVYVDNNSTPSYTFTGPDFTQNTFITQKFGGPGIPRIDRDHSVRIVVTVNSTEQNNYVAWHWVRNALGFHRVPFTLTSSVPGGQGYINTFERTFTIFPNHKLGVHSGFISASTHESLYDDDPNLFASSEVGFLYWVTR